MSTHAQMSAPLSSPLPPEAQRRQFGRRDASRPAVALVPGHAPAPCLIVNVSEGGALVQFTSGALPERNFRLTIDDAPFVLVCEIRHRAHDSVGVRFLNPADGARVMAHLFPGPPVPTDRTEHRAPAETHQAQPVNSRALRRQVLDALGERTRAAERKAASETEARPDLRHRVAKRLRATLAALSPAKTVQTEESSVAVARTHLAPQPPAPPAVAPVIWPDEPFAYQPRRSRKKGIKGRSAGGMG